MVAQRKTPDSTNSVEPYDATQYKRDVNGEVTELWKRIVTRINSVGGTSNAITGSVAVAGLLAPLTSYQGLFLLRPIAANLVGGVTIIIDTVGNVSLLDPDGNALAAGVLVVGRDYLLEADGVALRVVGTLGLPSSGALTAAPDLIIRDEKTAGVAGGTATSGSFAKRTLNTIVRNILAGATLSASQFTLQPGTYCIEWSAPASGVGFHQTRLFNATDSGTVETGTSELSGTGVSMSTRSIGVAVVTITSPKAFEIDHIVQSTLATSGFGPATSLAAKEVFTWVKVWKTG